MLKKMNAPKREKDSGSESDHAPKKKPAKKGQYIPDNGLWRCDKYSEIRDFDWLWCHVAMVVAIDFNVYKNRALDSF